MPCGFAPAKVNLFLHVIGRRADGLHLLDSLAVFAAVGDRVGATLAPALSLSIDGPFAAGLSAEADNLVLRAAGVLAAACGVATGAQLTLHKVLPVASGIGGGSADAAAALRVLSPLWGVRADLPALAVGLGADVAVCLGSRPARMGGVGERLAPSPALPPCGIALVNPGVPVATADIFRARRGAFSAPARLPEGWSDVGALAAWLAPLSNDLQAPAVAVCPPVATVLEALAELPGCLLARMSGSGATCFGLFPTPAAAEAAAVRMARPGWWCWGGGLLHSGASVAGWGDQDGSDG